LQDSVTMACVEQLRKIYTHNLDRIIAIDSKSHNIAVRGLMEYPTIVLSRAAQIRAGLWKRNCTGNESAVIIIAKV
jgi:hypothetical protein